MARKLKKFVIPTALGTALIASGISAAIYQNSTKPTSSNYRFTVSEIKERISPVTNEVESKLPMKPFLEETVGKAKDFYQRNDNEETQNNSLMYYEKTYMPSTGILYSSDELFEIVAAMDGEVKDIGDDNILGKYIVIEHNNGYKTTYYSLSETSVTKGAKVVKGDVIGASGENKIEGSTKHNVLFETYHDGYLIDPEDFYNIDFNATN